MRVLQNMVWRLISPSKALCTLCALLQILLGAPCCNPTFQKLMHPSMHCSNPALKMWARDLLLQLHTVLAPRNVHTETKAVHVARKD